MPQDHNYRKPPEFVFNRFKVFRGIASHLAKRQMYQQSLPFYKLAEDFARGHGQECTLASERSLVYSTIGEVEKARKDVDKAMAVCPANFHTMLVNAEVLFAENEIEDSLVVSHAGLRGRSLFGAIVRAATGAIENAVGVRAGEMMSMKQLGPTIIKMKMDELGRSKPKTPLTPLEKRKRDSAYQMKVQYYSGKYLGQIAAEKAFLLAIQKRAATSYTGDWTVCSAIDGIVRNAIKNIDRHQASLWQRCPLYSMDYLGTKISKSLRRRQQRSHACRMTTLNNEAVRQLRCIAVASRQDFTVAYKKCLNLWRFLASKPYSLLRNKRVLFECLYEMMGVLYIDTKRLIDSWTDEVNDQRIYYMMGIERPYSIRVELYKNHFHAEILNPKEFISEMTEYYVLSVETLEIAVAAYELACAYCITKDKERARMYSRMCISESKRGGHVVWYLNGLIMLCRVELLDANAHEARVVLTAARDNAHMFGFAQAAKFLSRALELISLETDDTLKKGASVAKREKQLVDHMVTPEYRFACSKVIAHKNMMPLAVQLAVMPGGRSPEESAEAGRTAGGGAGPLTGVEASAEAAARIAQEEQRIQHTIRGRFTLNPPLVDTSGSYGKFVEKDLSHLVLLPEPPSKMDPTIDPLAGGPKRRAAQHVVACRQSKTCGSTTARKKESKAAAKAFRRRSIRNSVVPTLPVT